MSRANSLSPFENYINHPNCSKPKTCNAHQVIVQRHSKHHQRNGEDMIDVYENL
jgi:hypothetical protein